MKRYIIMIGCALAAYVACAGEAVTGDSGKSETTQAIHSLITALIPMAAVAVASLLANLFEVRSLDKPWIKLLKKLCNLIALNLSHKAGK